MSAHDDIPKDAREAHQCPECYFGIVTQNEYGLWECDVCSFKKED